MISRAQKQKYQAYVNATQTVAKTKQIVMLYDGIIRFLQQAKEAMQENRIEDRYHLLIKASEVINGLQGCLDFENGGQIAKVLYSFYATADSRIFTLHRTASPKDCEEIIADLKQMRDVWDEIDKSNSAQGNAGADQPVVAAPSAPAVPPAAAEIPAGVSLSA